MKRFAIATLGCKVNTYESQGYVEQLLKWGFRRVDFKDVADVYIINTCAVTNTAASKSRQKIHQAQRQNKTAVICVVGCLVQTTKEDLGVDIVVGSSGKAQLAAHIRDVLNAKKVINTVQDMSEYTAFEPLKVSAFQSQARAFLKIQDGCNQFCAYCIIPYARGRERSLPLCDVVESATALVQAGHKEIVLSGIHTGRYGHDIGCTLYELLTHIIRIEGLQRIRISSIEINEVSDALLELIKTEEKIANHLHIPIQSGCDQTLLAMHRPYTIEAFTQRIKYIKECIPQISISSDIILGFPQESDENFACTYKTIENVGFSFLHVFPFSKRDGTRAATIKCQMSNAEKKKRCHAISLLSKKHYNEYKLKFMHKDVDVLFEYEKEGYLFGHTSEYIPVMALMDINKLNTIQRVRISDERNGILYSE